MAIRRVTYLSVAQQVADDLGWDASNLSTDEWSLINRKVNLYAPWAWEHFYWPEWTLCERRTYKQPWDTTTTFAAGTIVYYRASRLYYVALRSALNQVPATGSGGAYTTNLDYWAEAAGEYSADEYSATKAYVKGERVYYPTTDKYYQLYAATSTGNLPTDTTKWGELIALERTVAYEQSWETNAIGEVKAAWDNNPRVTAASEVDKVLQDNGVRILGSSPFVWLEFLQRVPSWTGSVYSASATYAVNDQIYFTDGDYYKCISATSAGESPSTASAKWTRLDFPYALWKYTAAAVSANIRGKNDGQAEKYPSEADEAYGILAAEFDKLERQQGQTTQLSVRT